MRSILIFLSAFILFSCSKDSRSISDIYKFGETKDVRVQVNLTYKLDVQGGPAVSMGNPKFILNAFLYQGGEIPVQIAYAGQEPVTDLAVNLSASTLTFDATLRLPAAAKVTAEGYALHFSLREELAAVALDEADSNTVKNLEALKGGVQPGADPSANPVSLSLATTIAYRIVSEASLSGGNAIGVAAYQQLLAVVDAEIKKVEANIDPGAAPNLATYASAILAGTKLAVMQNPTVQSAIIGILQPAVEASTGQNAAASVSNSMSNVLTSYATDVKAALGSAAASEFKIFKANSYDPATIPDPATYVPAVNAPLGLAFTDTDYSVQLGGNIVITPPASESGIDTYNVYFGGNSLASAKLVLAGSVKKGTSPLQVVLAPGTAQVPSSTHFWVFPSVNGKDFSSALSTAIVNLIPISIPSNLSATGGITSNSLTWTGVQGASSYNVYWSTTSPVTISSQKLSAPSASYLHQGLANASTYHYAVTAIKDGRESALSAEASATTRAIFTFSGSPSLNTTQCWSEFNDIAVARTGDVYVAGSTNCDLPSDVALAYTQGFLARFSASGALVWVKPIFGATSNGNSTEGLAVAVSLTGKVYIGGKTNGDVVQHTGTAVGSSDIWYAQYSGDGTSQWIKQQGVASQSIVLSGIAADDNGFLYVSGETAAQLPNGPALIGNRDGFLYKIDPSNGLTSWLRTIGTTNGGGSDETIAASVAVSHDGSQIYLMGQINGDLTGGSQPYDSVFVAQYSAAGARNWIRQTRDGNGPKKSFGAVQLSPDESSVFAVGGTTIDFTNGSLAGVTIYKLVYSSTGSLVDMMQVGVPSSVKVKDMIPLADSSIIVTGYTDDVLTTGSKVGNTDWFITKFAADHTQTWVVEKGVASHSSFGLGIAADGLGNIVTAGYSDGDLSAGSGAAPGNKAGYLIGLKPDGSDL